MIRILSTSLTSVSIFSVGCYSRYLSRWLFVPYYCTAAHVLYVSLTTEKKKGVFAGLESTASLCMAITLKTRKEERKAKPQAKLRATVTQKINIPIIPSWGMWEGWREGYTLLLFFKLASDNIWILPLCLFMTDGPWSYLLSRNREIWVFLSADNNFLTFRHFNWNSGATISELL